METLTTAPVSFSPAATAELKRLMHEEGFDASRSLRVGVKGGGCSGLSYILEFDDAREGDEHFTLDGIPCVMDPAHGLYLMGMQIDWGSGLDARGFVFTNPNASKTCGCGSSFAV